MKKKTIAIVLAILAVVMCFTLAACGDKTNVDDSLNDGANISDVADATEGEDEATEGEAEEATDDLAYIKERLGKPGAVGRVAELVLKIAREKR